MKKTMGLNIGDDWTEGILVEKLNRFLASANVEGHQTFAHIPNSGRLAELLTPGRKAVFTKTDNPNRKTKWTLQSVWFNNRWVSINSNTPNHLFEYSLVRNQLPPFSGFTRYKRETTRGNSRFDFLLTYPEGKECLVEVKSVTLVVGDVGRFPDAPTERGRKHLLELLRFVQDGIRGALFFCVQRSDASKFQPNDGTDPEFGRILREISKQDVEIYAYNCRVGKNNISLHHSIPVDLG